MPFHETEYAADGVFAYRALASSSGRRSDPEDCSLRARGVNCGSTSCGRAGRRRGEAEELAARRATGRARSRCGHRGGPGGVAEGYRRRGNRNRCGRAVRSRLRRRPRRHDRDSARADADSVGRLLVVCGSWVPMSTRQLRALDDAYPGLIVEVDVRALAGPGPREEAARAAQVASDAIARAGLAISPRHATGPRGRSALTWDGASPRDSPARPAWSSRPRTS